MQIRKLFTQVEEIRSEAGQPADEPLRKVAVVAVIKNPLAGQPYADDLGELTEASVAIGREISALAQEAMKPYRAVSYGKGGVVGTAGEQEHVVAMLTTVYGNEMREAAGGGKAWISSFTKRAAPGSVIEVPLAHKDALYVRSHYDGMSIMLSDAPLPDEMALICVYANRGRLNARVGGLAADEITGEDGLV
ncbi:amino acid synthesis family protein [Roseitranquillus sediminis]|uniref:amino acid synthesis family protein n=1 Tax=Roseitranquillus sediminis TaxID=2809051 RepID=UPI001D0C6EE1|nr:amino acid synthesis family protein [Roseitranquillus sediminis]MBM9594454.1 amino acid synthesis family protein [Roseitranquillus sediminis]